jgi:hypothetical protein
MFESLLDIPLKQASKPVEENQAFAPADHMTPRVNDISMSSQPNSFDGDKKSSSVIMRKIKKVSTVFVKTDTPADHTMPHVNDVSMSSPPNSFDGNKKSSSVIMRKIQNFTSSVLGRAKCEVRIVW